MSRGVKPGTKRGCYKRIGKPRLRALARAIRAGKIDPEAVAQAFESAGGFPNLLIAKNLRSGAEFAPDRLALAVERLASQPKPGPQEKQLQLWMAKAALRHLVAEYGGQGLPIHLALGVDYPYGEDKTVRAYYRQLRKDHGARSKRAIEKRLAEIWPKRAPDQFPELEQAIRESLSGYGVPLAIWRSLRSKRNSRI